MHFFIPFFQFFVVYLSGVVVENRSYNSSSVYSIPPSDVFKNTPVRERVAAWGRYRPFCDIKKKQNVYCNPHKNVSTFTI